MAWNSYHVDAVMEGIKFSETNKQGLREDGATRKKKKRARRAVCQVVTAQQQSVTSHISHFIVAGNNASPAPGS
jgi:hypothetical protein